jgi:hypothetical protein
MSMRIVWVLLGCALVTIPALEGDGVAQVLHEPVTVGVLHCSGGICTGAGGEGRVKAIEHNGQVLYPPGGEAQPRPGEQIFAPQPERPVEIGGGDQAAAAAGDHPPDRRDIIHTDRDTGPEGPGTRVYHLVFNPEPYPYKRMTALDGVRIQPCAGGAPGCDDEVLVVHDREQLPVAGIGLTHEPARDLFWGSIVIDFEPGRTVPIPSVSPDSHILEARTEPPVPVTFYRDGADNFFVASTAGGRHRLIWLSDAPRSYFAGELPARARLADEPRELLRPLPPALKARAQQVIRHIGITYTRASSLKSVLDPLVAYFRAFDVGTLPPPSGSSYLDLAMNQKGCCRHRSYAFAITAMAMGIPVRYVENEVHVYVEVFVPRVGWRRINLGGAPVNEELAGSDGKTLYSEQGVDPFPKPDVFLKAAQAPSALPKLGATTANANGNGNANVTVIGNGSASSSSVGGKVDLAALDAASVREAAASPQRAKTHISVELGTRSSFRGDAVEVGGVVRSDGGDASALAVDIYLDGPAGAVRVGETVTDAGGRWHASIEVPRDLAVGDHRVVARIRGDERRAPASSRGR